MGDEQDNRINLMQQQINNLKIKDELKGKQYIKINKYTEEIKYDEMKKDMNLNLNLNQKNRSFVNRTMAYFDYGWDVFKEKISEKEDIISFQRTKWENIYHSLFAYFMNGLMVIFTLLTKTWMFIGFILSKFAICCLCKKEGNKEKKRRFHPPRLQRQHSHSMSNIDRNNFRRRNIKKRNRMRRNNNNQNNVWRENSENDVDSVSSGY